ncbi:unnamed protein product (macronuclear) [Paramecium tetraurelia]|uniref:BAH domain-containing protein n=1 Tax=Paramecium tetraurelia TaxID=5888 RepID=A0BIR2_PARTE|nr:uncharacterized protein GSPATT00004801001 [Paramecium tetraurelia]CAK58429.1 unnamed protein product [Paramecium tetraurelia]|eukprot:XP_001425827.1 hypothetical protein (macronuclear) [Paramecium tetraurelia strain d4-2]
MIIQVYKDLVATKYLINFISNLKLILECQYRKNKRLHPPPISRKNKSPKKGSANYQIYQEEKIIDQLQEFYKLITNQGQVIFLCFRTNYQKLKYENQIYHVGQNLCIRGDNRSIYVAKLIKIVKLYDDEDNCLPFIKVRWFRRKTELTGLSKDCLDCISENEVFKTNEFDYIEIESIVGLATILSFEEYDQIEELYDNVFFTRAQYVNEKLLPPFQQWKKVCICKKSANPDLKYIFCDLCQRWFHLKCVGLSQDQAEKINKYICPECKN